ncbi:MAG: acetamidase/formamidase family protein [Planctomycetia bacterium]|nr:acetamidase/formamidase family protein [Planctomycetia bacterium]
MKHLTAKPLSYEFTRLREPRVRIQSGETLIVETEDALSGQIRKAGDRRDRTTMPFSNPQTGPIYVEGAEPGDSLAVTIHEIKPILNQCATYTGNPKQLCEWLGTDCPQNAHVMPIRDGLIYFSDEITIPYTPMLGCLGTAPDIGSPTALPAGPYGGNMDIIEVCPGNTISLPVFVTGGFLYLGDAHAAMGHGELSATGLEMPAETRLTVNLIKGKKLLSPRIESPTEIMTVVSGCPMERSAAEAFARLILWMEEDYGWNRWQSYDLLTHVARMSIGYYGIGTIAAKVEKRYLVPVPKLVGTTPA